MCTSKFFYFYRVPAIRITIGTIRAIIEPIGPNGVSGVTNTGDSLTFSARA